jgi:hypothetical protein
VELEWSEDTGWAVSHCSFVPDPSAWRYCPTALVPDPSVVARFVRDALANPRTAQRYPTRFRHRGQPLRVVTDQLAERQPERNEPHKVHTATDHGHQSHPTLPAEGGLGGTDRPETPPTEWAGHLARADPQTALPRLARGVHPRPHRTHAGTDAGARTRLEMSTGRDVLADAS